MKTINFFIFIVLFFSFLFISNVKGYSEVELEKKVLNQEESAPSIFDNVQWIKIKEKDGVILFIKKNKLNNYYKAEKLLYSTNGDKFFTTLMNINDFSKVFPKTIIFKPVKNISSNKYLMYCQVDFKPLKNRDYYIILEYSYVNKNNIKEWIIEWYPLDNLSDSYPVNEDLVRVKDIYGRWKIIESNNNVKISIEYFNNFNLLISKLIKEPFEKNSIIHCCILDILDYN